MEIVYAAGWVPVDINNRFIGAMKPGEAVEKAEQAGFPRNVCGWIKGLYSTLLEGADIRHVIAVTQGDCSNTHALMETWQVAGIEVIPFAFPYDRDADMLRLQMEKLAQALGASWDDVIFWKKRLDQVRSYAHQLDELTWRTTAVTGEQNHLALIGCSDFDGDPEAYEARLQQQVEKALAVAPPGWENHIVDDGRVRIGYVGVPPIQSDFYALIEEWNGRIVYNEVQRQFAMPVLGTDLVEQYRAYTYPYSVFFRLEDMQQQIAARRIDGIIHYTQSFCFRQIEDMILRRQIQVPVLTIEGDRPGPVDARTCMRMEAFIDMVGQRKRETMGR
ncbi:2-hydroxyacyl-CoA dehydratase family protein [Heliophilum fasciatum]|uniref:Benzoyl-CoA reductase/2-hydroxyglutaryl-CoA dehydratase subunit BcrC/BadD/HgdB n=1 Tax=Heliophilum fasciatum TaxID=35700 RepID=A0A4R2RV39_9FIRM|nr:2-hydroxyacyl-CoA dehydratase family protein [Heliophilum fasciatum]TCP67274.1 benzoyl-CoA reductase/2-hydroxyglutaryl-CoA dehydratase subunit BcrC/BadD/HgdB [Heliophilum fasciatum]